MISEFRRHLLINLASSSKLYETYITTGLTDEMTSGTFKDKFPDLLPDTLYKMTLILMGKGGTSGASGDGWGLYRGGTGGAGANGGIVIVTDQVHSNAQCNYVRSSGIVSFDWTDNGYSNVVNVYDGGNGGNGGDAGAFTFSGAAGDGGTGSANYLILNSPNAQIVLNYYDPQAPDGVQGGAGTSSNVTQPNALPSVPSGLPNDEISFSYAQGGYSNYTGGGIAGGQGAYYLALEEIL